MHVVVFVNVCPQSVDEEGEKTRRAAVWGRGRGPGNGCALCAHAEGSV